MLRYVWFCVAGNLTNVFKSLDNVVSCVCLQEITVRVVVLGDAMRAIRIRLSVHFMRGFIVLHPL